MKSIFLTKRCMMNTNGLLIMKKYIGLFLILISVNVFAAEPITGCCFYCPREEDYYISRNIIWGVSILDILCVVLLTVLLAVVVFLLFVIFLHVKNKLFKIK